ncbi:ABC transporter permease [Yinghuangia soli]|uniref:ABC transporter permease n=1 Tax=Yinghuangia soli TaxID=2908204 RepID=A0AA41PYR0_9ACTN|nr:ABC transporter permease [Yinghuangia soli]MCF2528228.1 ABC transporter permease [Yinghuangia soli]
MFRTSLRNLTAHKLRLALTCLTIVFGVAFVSGVLIFGDSASKAMTDAAKHDYDNVSVSVRTTDAARDDGQLPPLTDGFLAEVRGLPGGAAARGDVSGFTAVVDKKNDLVGPAYTAAGANFSPGPDGTDPEYAFTAGRGPASAGEVAIDAATAEKAGFRVGDRVKVVGDGPVMEKTLSGVFTTDSAKLRTGGTLTLFDTATAQGLFTRPGSFDEITAKAAPGTSDAALLAGIKPLAPGGTKTVTGATLAADDQRAIKSATSSMSTGLLVFAVIALFVGAFVIANTFTMLVAQRTRETALLRAIGATRRQVVRSVRFEALLLGLAGSAAGIAAGAGLALGLKALLAAGDNGLPDGPLVVTAGTVVWSLAVGVGVTVVAAWLPARRAAKVAPVAALRADLPQSAASLVRRNVAGAVVTAAGVALMVLVGQSGTPMETKLLGIVFGAVVALAGIVVLTPLIAGPVIRGLGAVFGKVFGVEGRLAKENALRNPRRTASTAAALMIGLVLVTAMSVFGSSLKGLLDSVALKGITADYTVSSVSHRPLDPGIAATVAGLPDVAASSPSRPATLTVAGKDRDAKALDGEQGFKVLHADFLAGGPEGLRNGLVVSERAAKDNGWKAGDRVPVEFADGKTADLVVGGVYEDSDLLGDYLVSTQTLAPHVQRSGDEMVLVAAVPGKEKQLRSELKAALGDNPALQIQTKDDLRKEFGGAIDQMLTILYGLLGMAIAIAVVGIVNTLAMSVFERTRELGMLRAVGLDRRRMRRMIRLESVAISVFGAGLGIVLGLAAGAFGIMSARGEAAGLEVVVPWDRVGIFLGLAVLVGILAAWWPARRAAKLDVLDALHAE